MSEKMLVPVNHLLDAFSCYNSHKELNALPGFSYTLTHKCMAHSRAAKWKFGSRNNCKFARYFNVVVRPSTCFSHQ
jgi:hypothetical protein